VPQTVLSEQTGLVDISIEPSNNDMFEDLGDDTLTANINALNNIKNTI